MQLTPLEITQREFRRVLRGYDPDEVRHFIESVADEVGNLGKDLADREERIAELEARVQALEGQESSLRNTLVTAQRMTEEIKANAKREADLIVREAEAKAQRVVADTQNRVADVQREFQELRGQRDLFAATLRAHIQAHLELLQSGFRRDAKDSREPRDAPQDPDARPA